MLQLTVKTLQIKHFSLFILPSSANMSYWYLILIRECVQEKQLLLVLIYVNDIRVKIPCHLAPC